MVEKLLLAASSKKSTKPIWPVTKETMGSTPEAAQKWAAANDFKPSSGNVLLVPNAQSDGIEGALFGIGDGEMPLAAGALAKKLPDGAWRFEQADGFDLRLATIGFLLGAYRFTRYKENSSKQPQLVLDKSLDRSDIVRQAEAVWTTRDLINTPAGDMGPDQIEAAARSLAKTYKATVKTIQGDDLLKKNFPMIHAVGRAADIEPRLIDLSWGNKKAPKLTLVGKGVAFDTGGLDIKPASSMRNMKKDMGGAANVLGLAQMIMDAKLKVRLRVLVPAVENAIAGNAFRPGDILQTRQGLTVEIGHTDAEGRLVLGDALTLACEEDPDLLIDMATLTGAARVALGPELPPYYTDDDDLAEAIEDGADKQHDPLWRLPLWQPYKKALSSKVADLNNVTTDGFAGSITAALFLQHFVKPEVSWAHFDIFGWTPSAKPHAPIGGEAQAIRALFDAISERYA